MPIRAPYPAVPPTVYETGTVPALQLSRAGTVLPLTVSTGWVVLAGVQGLDDPPRTLIEVQPATGDGSILMDTRYLARDVFLPLNYKAATTTALRTALRALAALTDVKAGDVTLEVAHTDGTRRYIDGRLSQPFAPNALGQGEAALWRTLGITLHCPDPFWYTDTSTLSWTLGGDPVPFLGATFLPFGLDNSQVLGDTAITNDGDAHAYPVWTLTGPCDSATVTAGDTSWTVTDGLTDDETLVIDARRGVKTCEINGVSAWGRLTPGSIVATLPPGDTLLDVEAVGATSETTITVQWQERWLTAW